MTKTATIATLLAEIAEAQAMTDDKHQIRALAACFGEMQQDLRDAAGSDEAAQAAFEEAGKEWITRNGQSRLPVYHLDEYSSMPNGRLTEMAWAGNEEAAFQLAQNLKHAEAMENHAYVVTVRIRTSDRILEATIPTL